MPDELKPCPFCGGTARVDKTLRDGYQNYQQDPQAFAWFVICNSCAAQGPWKKVQSNAVRGWNMREASR